MGTLSAVSCPCSKHQSDVAHNLRGVLFLMASQVLIHICGFRLKHPTSLLILIVVNGITVLMPAALFRSGIFN